MKFDGFKKINGKKIRCILTQHASLDDAPTIVVFPGGPGFGYGLYKDHSGFIEDVANVLYFDPAGCGESDPEKDLACYTMKNYTNDVKSLLDELHIEKAIIFGTSYGSMAALDFALRFPDNLAGLILVAGAPSYRFLDQAKRNLQERGSEVQKKSCNKLWTGGFEAQEELNAFFRVMGPMYSVKAGQPLEEASVATVNPYPYQCALDPLNAAFASNFERFDFTERLTEVEVPVLILDGESDWINPPEGARIMADKFTDSTLHVIRNCGHSVAKDQPDFYKQIVMLFINVKLILSECS